MSRGRVLFYVQHLLGVGHIKRASIIARALATRGLEVSVVLGGPEIKGIRFDGCARIPLPPIRAADETFRLLVDEHGAAIGEELREARTARLLTEFEALRPHVLLIEQFPFGRRQFRFELMPLLAAARTAEPRPGVLSSVRDVLIPKSDPAKNRQMASWARTWFDRILVHGDARLFGLDASFVEAAEISSLLHYTGYVVEPPPPVPPGEAQAGRGEVIVSVGGGAVGEPLLRAALAARPLSRLASVPWRLMTGPNLPDAVYDALAWNPPPGVIIERWRADLPVLLRNCVLSISQGGYNTIMDILTARAKAVVVPFAEGDQTEQAFRARELAARGVIAMVEPEALSAETLARAVDTAADRHPSAARIDLSGAETTARIVADLCRAVGAAESAP